VSVILSIEKRKRYSAPYETLFRACARAASSLDLQPGKVDESSGVIEARKKSTWPFKSKEGLFLTVGRDCRVVAIAKIDMNKVAAQGDLLDRFFTAVGELLENEIAAV
jgi:hypothetical protein